MKTGRLEAFSDGETFWRHPLRHDEAPVGIAPAAVFFAAMIPSRSTEKRFSFRAVCVRLYRQTVQQQERETKT